MRPIAVCFVTGIVTLLGSQSWAETDDLYLSCKITVMRLCQGDTTLEGCPKPWLPTGGSDSNNPAFHVSRVEGKWTLKKDNAAELTLANPSGDFFEFTFTRDDEWARLRIDRLRGELFELYGLSGDDFLATKVTCEKAER